MKVKNSDIYTADLYISNCEEGACSFDITIGDGSEFPKSKDQLLGRYTFIKIGRLYVQLARIRNLVDYLALRKMAKSGKYTDSRFMSTYPRGEEYSYLKDIRQKVLHGYKLKKMELNLQLLSS